MRPVSLQVEAFSCFRDAQEALDFSALSLFAISGPTGAGKSSILDAITFALYGHVPRLGKQGISDVISLGRDRMTVRFEFAVGDRRFRIGRELRRKKATSVILEEITSGTERLLADKVREVDEQITALTGLRYETFIQTVLLPQGEFDRFLHSDPGERGKVLRELLKLDMYERMRVRAEQDSRQQHQQLTLMRERLDQDYADATPENLSSARTTLAEITDREALARTAAEAATKQLQEVQARFAQSTELAGRRARLEQLDSRRDRIAVDRERLEKARRAAPLIPRLDGLIAAEERVTIAQRELEEARAASQAAQSNVNRQLAARGRAQKEAAIVPALRTRIQALDELRGVLERRTQVAADIQSTKSAITAGTKDEKAAATEVQKTETATADAERDLADAKKAMDRIGYDARRHRALEPVVADAIRGGELYRQLTVAKRQVTTAANKAVEAEAAGKEAAVTVEKDKAAFNRARDQVHKAEAALEQARNMNHAAALRPTLKQGDPCPVCEQAVERLPRRLRAPELEDCEKAVEQAKRAESRAARTLEESRHVAASAASQAKERREVAEDRLADVQRIEKEITRISKKLTGVVAISHPGDEIPAELFKAVSNEANRWMALKQQFDAANERFNSADRTLQQARHRKEQAATTLKHLASRNEELRTRLSQLQEEQSEIASRIAAVTKNPDPAAERQELAKQVSDVEAADRRAEEALQTARRSLEAATARVSSAGKALSDRRADASSAADDVRAALADSGFADSSAVRAAALSSDEQQRLDTAIRGYDSERHQTEVRIFELENALAGRYVTEQDRRDADDEARGARDAHEAAAEMLTRSRHEVDRLGAQVERAMELRREVTAIETRVSLSDRLARDLKNDGFQRYLLEEAFRGLVDGASARMRQWTNRYTLEWDDGAFYAIDHDNGGERRRAETLSGGETFLASLSLALQLSEEVLRTAGAVQIDSLFIDEGFSTLDLEALDVVAEAIESLRIGGRMVGIITHIRDLTERLPGCIEVEKGQGESRWAVARVG